MSSPRDGINDDLFDEIIEFDQDIDESDKENRKRKKGNKAKKLQMNKLNTFMTEHSELCIEKAKDLWGNLVDELNALGPPFFTDSEWKLKWSQHKYNKKRKLTTEITGPSTETAGPSIAIAITSPNDEQVVEQPVTLSDILNKLIEMTEKQDAIIETLNTTNKLLEKIAENLTNELGVKYF